MIILLKIKITKNNINFLIFYIIKIGYIILNLQLMMMVILFLKQKLKIIKIYALLIDLICIQII